MNSEDPLVSVCITTYQHAPFIQRCLDGVLMQRTSFPFEILVGEHASSDGTREICLDYARRFRGTIRLFLHERSSVVYINGVPTGLNNLLNNLREARGRYIALCEGDDYWTDPEKLQLQVEVLERQAGAAGVFHNWWEIEERDSRPKLRIHDQPVSNWVSLADLIMNNNVQFASMMFRNQIDWGTPPGWFFKTLKGDYGVALIVAGRGNWAYIDRAMSVYRVNATGMWSGASGVAKATENVKFFTLLLGAPEFAQVRPTILARRRTQLLELALCEAREGLFARSIGHYLASVGPRVVVAGRPNPSVLRYALVCGRALLRMAWRVRRGGHRTGSVPGLPGESGHAE